MTQDDRKGTPAGLLGAWAKALMSKKPGPQVAARLSLEQQPSRVYAIGDVHGNLDCLTRLEAQIVDDAKGTAGEKLIVMLGDLVDRGPQSAQVIDHILADPPDGFRRLCLRGNHEAMMLHFIQDPRRGTIWLDNGGRETMLSYGMPGHVALRGLAPRAVEAIISRYIPKEHVAFLKDLPVLIEAPETIFVHAGLRPGLPLARQSDDDLIWIRDNYQNDYAEFGKTVVHGHMPRTDALVSTSRIAVDTGVYSYGRLSAVRIMPGKPPKLFSVTRERPRRG